MIPGWRPTASLANLRLRARLLNCIRQFFQCRDVLEVETPLLGRSTATDPKLVSFESSLHFPGANHQETLFLQTSPEYAMKRLVAAGSGSIFQICKAFRNGETGKKHNPEFTMLEWYRVGFTHCDLMEEVDALLQSILGTGKAQYISYRDLFAQHFSINPHTCPVSQLKAIAKQHDIIFEDKSMDRDLWLDLLLTHLIEPTLGEINPIFIYDYPQSQAALAKLREVEDYVVGERFELYYQGMELANGYHELCDPNEQLRRFLQDNQIRKEHGLPTIPLDRHLLDALDNFPNCAGVALGIDRLIALAAKTDDIADVIPFPVSSV